MTILESWEDHNGNRYAIVRHSRQDQKEYRLKAYEAVWLDEDGQLGSFGGSPGMRLADFDTLNQARDFLLKGIDEFDENPEIWFEMVAIV